MTSSKIETAPCSRAQLQDPLQKARAAAAPAHVADDRLDDDGGDAPALAREQLARARSRR